MGKATSVPEQVSPGASQSLCGGHPALGPTSGSEAYRKSASASESSHGRRKSLSVSIMIQVAILILLAEVNILIQCRTADTGGL